MTKEDLYFLCREAVVNMPEADSDYDRIDSFAVIRDPSEVAAENFGKDVTYKDRPFFYSRYWEKQSYPAGKVGFRFPAIFAIELPGTILNGFTQQMKPQTRIQLSAVYPNEEVIGKDKFKRPKKAVQEELYNIMLNHLFYVLRYVQGGVYASIDSAPYTWSNRAFLDWKKAEGMISDFVVDPGTTRSTIKTLQNTNQILNADYIDDVPPMKLIGRSIIITLQATECSTTVTPVFSKSECCKQL